MTCAKCNRAILKEHVDDKGLCCDCSPKPKEVGGSDKAGVKG